jgi:hypothetical protein
MVTDKLEGEPDQGVSVNVIANAAESNSTHNRQVSFLA